MYYIHYSMHFRGWNYISEIVQTSCLNCSAINDEKLAKTQCQSKTAFDQPIIIIIVIEENGWKVSDVQLPF